MEEDDVGIPDDWMQGNLRWLIQAAIAIAILFFVMSQMGINVDYPYEGFLIPIITALMFVPTIFLILAFRQIMKPFKEE